jgi:hypothetical protein
MSLFLDFYQTITSILFYLNIHLSLSATSLVIIIIYSFHLASFVSLIANSKNSYLLFKVKFDNYEPKLDTLY